MATEATPEPIAFERCACVDPVPDPLRYTLPNGTTVELVACVECGNLADWTIDEAGPEAELRELVREKSAELEELRSVRDELQADLEAVRDERDRLQAELDAQTAEQADDQLRQLVRELRTERDELADRVDGLEDALADREAELTQLRTRLNERDHQATADADREYTPARHLFAGVVGLIDRHLPALLSSALALGITVFAYDTVMASIQTAPFRRAADAAAEPPMLLVAGIVVAVSMIIGFVISWRGGRHVH